MAQRTFEVFELCFQGAELGLPRMQHSLVLLEPELCVLLLRPPGHSMSGYTGPVKINMAGMLVWGSREKRTAAVLFCSLTEMMRACSVSSASARSASVAA